MKKLFTLFAVSGLLLALVPAAQAAVTAVDSVTTNGSINIVTITVGSTTYATDDMVTGISSGAGSGTVTDMDNFNLNSQFSPSGTWDTEFAGENLTGAGFFLFEAGGNDALSVKPIFMNDTTGNSLTLTTGSAGAGYNWGDISVVMTAGARSGQNAFGLTFSYGDLLNGSGANLTTEVIKGLEFTHDGVDPASISAWLVVQEIDITGNGNSITHGDITPTTSDDTDFGSTTNNGTIVKTYTVTNSGTAELTLTNATLTGAGAAQFAVGTLTSTTLTNGGTAATFTVTYTASGAPATHDATVSLGNNDGNENPYTFAITAETRNPAPEIDITGLGNSISDGDSTPSLADDTDFGFTWIDGGDIVKTYTVTNTGDAVLTLSNPASITGAGEAHFLVGPLTSTSLNAGEAATFTVTYMESYTVAVHTATVNLVNDDSNEATYDFAITAETGIMPEIDITGNGISIIDGDTTPSTTDDTDFGSVVIGTEAVKTYTVKNTGFGDLHLSPPTLTGTGTNQFTVGALTATNVTSGQTATFTVTYTTTVARAEHTATVTLVNNDPDEESTYNFKIKALSWNPRPIVLPPDGITTYRIAFVTSGKTLAQDTGIAYYNGFVTTAASNVPELAALSTTWKCIGSTLNTSAKANTGTLLPADSGYLAANDVPIYTTDGNRIADDNADLWDGTIQNPIYYGDGTQAGDGTGGEVAWTGTDSDGSSASDTVHGGSYLGSGPNGDNTSPYMRSVRGGYTDGGWISGPSAHDGISQSLMGMSGVIRGVPTPGTLMFGD